MTISGFLMSSAVQDLLNILDLEPLEDHERHFDAVRHSGRIPGVLNGRDGSIGKFSIVRQQHPYAG